MSLKKEFSKSVIANWLGTLCSAILAFFLTPIIVHSFGNERYGIWSIAISLTGYYGILDVGIRTTIVRYFAHYHETHDHHSNNVLINTMFTTYFLIVPVVMAVVFVLRWKADTIFNIDPSHIAETRTLIFIIGINFCLNAMSNTFKAVIFGLRMFTVQNTLQITFSILRSAAIIVLLKQGYGIIEVAYAVVFLDQILNIVKYIIVKKSYPELKISPRFVKFKEMREHYIFAFFNFLRHMSTRIMERADIILVGILFDMESVTMYSIAESLLRYVSKVPKGLNSVILPFSSKLNAKAENKNLVKMILIIPKYTISFLFLVFLMAALFGKQFLEWWMGVGYDFSFIILMVLMVPKIMNDSQNVLTQVIVGMGYNRFYGVLSFIEVLMNITASIVLAKFFGVVGIALGTLFTMLLTKGIIVPIYTLKIVNLNFFKYYYNSIIRPLIPWILVYLLYPLCIPINSLFMAPIPAFIFLLLSYYIVYEEVTIKNWKLHFSL